MLMPFVRDGEERKLVDQCAIFQNETLRITYDILGVTCDALRVTCNTLLVVT